MLLPAIFATALLCCVSAESNGEFNKLLSSQYFQKMQLNFAVTTHVQAFISKYHSLQDGKDILNVLDRIGDDARELFMLGQPVGVLLRTFNNTGEVVFTALAQTGPLL